MKQLGIFIPLVFIVFGILPFLFLLFAQFIVKKVCHTQEEQKTRSIIKNIYAWVLVIMDLIVYLLLFSFSSIVSTGLFVILVLYHLLCFYYFSRKAKGTMAKFAFVSVLPYPLIATICLGVFGVIMVLLSIPMGCPARKQAPIEQADTITVIPDSLNADTCQP